jgi:hypothetical protein
MLIKGTVIRASVEAILSTKGYRVNNKKLNNGGRTMMWSGLTANRMQINHIESILKRVYEGATIRVYNTKNSIGEFTGLRASVIIPYPDPAEVLVKGTEISAVVRKTANIARHGIIFRSEKLVNGGRSMKWPGVFLSEGNMKLITHALKRMYPFARINVRNTGVDNRYECSPDDGLKITVSITNRWKD